MGVQVLKFFGRVGVWACWWRYYTDGVVGRGVLRERMRNGAGVVKAICGLSVASGNFERPINHSRPPTHHTPTPPTSYFSPRLVTIMASSRNPLSVRDLSKIGLEQTVFILMHSRT